MAACCSARGGKGLRTAPDIWVNDIISEVRTGDVLLTSNKDGGAKFIKLVTATKWNHVGIVVKPAPNRAYLVEWGGGLFACELVERLQEYAEFDTVDCVIRHLKVKDPANRRIVEERIEKFIDHMFREKLGQNRGIPLGSLYKAGQAMLNSDTSRGKAGEVVADDLNTLFCSKTVAVCYKAGGVLAANRHADSFIPKHFSESYASFLDMQNGATLGPEQRITFESRRLKDAVSNMLRMPVIEVLAYGSSRRQEEKAALLIEKFVRRMFAKRELARRKRAPKDEKVSLYKGAEEHGTKDRISMLKQMAGMGHKTPQDTLQVTWMDDDIQAPDSPPPKPMLI